MREKKRAKEGNLSKSSFFGAGVVVSAKHISSAPKEESSSTVELQIGGVAAPELVWWSRSPPKHALNRPHHHWIFGIGRTFCLRGLEASSTNLHQVLDTTTTLHRIDK
jgi:hypothetical protein